MTEKRTKQLQVRLTPDEERSLQDAARRAGLGLSVYIRSEALKAAREAEAK